MSEFDPFEENLRQTKVVDVFGNTKTLMHHPHNTAILDTVRTYPELAIEGDNYFNCLNTPILMSAALLAERDKRAYFRTRRYASDPIVEVDNPIVWFPTTNDRRRAEWVIWKSGFNAKHGIGLIEGLGLFVVLQHDMNRLPVFDAHRIINSNQVDVNSEDNYIEQILSTYFNYNGRLQRFLRKELYSEFANGEMTHQVLLRLLNSRLAQTGSSPILQTDITYTIES